MDNALQAEREIRADAAILAPHYMPPSARMRSTFGRAAAARKSIMRQQRTTVGSFNRALRYLPLARLGGRMPVSSRSSIRELKDITILTSSPITFNQASANLFLLNGVAQGTTAITRIGRRITMKSLLLKFQGYLAPTTTGAAALRMLVIYDSQSNATAPAATDVLLTDVFDSPMNLNNSRRFKTLCDEIVPCVGTAGPQAWAVNRYLKLNHVTEFNNGSAGTIGDIQTGAIYALFYQSGGLLIASPTAQLYSRVRFDDA